MVRPRICGIFSIRESRKSQCFQWFSALSEKSTPRTVIETRNWRATNCATPRNGEKYAIFRKWSNMWSDRRFAKFSAIGSAKKVSVFKGFERFSKFYIWNRWFAPETGALPTALHLDNRENSHLGACSQGRIRWLLREPSSLTKKHIVPPQMRWCSQGVYDFYWIPRFILEIYWGKSTIIWSCA